MAKGTRGEDVVDMTPKGGTRGDALVSMTPGGGVKGEDASPVNIEKGGMEGSSSGSNAGYKG